MIASALIGPEALAQALDSETAEPSAQPVETMLPATFISPRPAPRPQPPARHNVITWQPVTLAFATIDLEYERVVARYVSAYLAPAIVPGVVYEPSGGTTPYIYGVAADLGIRYYPWGPAPRGFFIGTYVGLMSFADSPYGGRSRGLGARIGTNLGYTMLLADIAVLSLGLGIEFGQFQGVGSTYVNSTSALTARLALGFAF